MDFFDNFLEFDMAVYQWVWENLWPQSHESLSLLDWFMSFCTLIGQNSAVWFVLIAVLFLFRRTRKAAICVGVAMLLDEVLINLVLKDLFARPRPFNLDIEWWNELFVYPDWLPVKLPSSYSFPSGHACAAFASSTAVIYTKRKYIYIPSFLLAFCIAFSRIYACAHYPSDVIAGALLGILLGVCALLLMRPLSRLYDRYITPLEDKFYKAMREKFTRKAA